MKTTDVDRKNARYDIGSTKKLRAKVLHIGYGENSPLMHKSGQRITFLADFCSLIDHLCRFFHIHRYQA